MTVRRKLGLTVLALACALMATSALAPAATTSKVETEDFQLMDISCASATQCTAVDSNAVDGPATVIDHEITFNPSSPGTPTPVTIFSDGSEVEGVACPSTTQCTAMGGAGEEVTFNPQAPSNASTAAVAGNDGPIHGIACPATTQCTTINKAGSVITFNPQAPSNTSATRIDRGDVFYGVACPSTTQCTVVTEAGSELTLNPQAASVESPTSIDYGYMLASVSCPSISECVAANNSGQVITFNPNGSAPPLVVQVTSSFNPGTTGEVVCPSPTQCTAIYTLPLNTEAYTFNPTSTAKPLTQLSMQSPTLDCPSQTLCAAVGSGNYVTVFNPLSPNTVTAAGWRIAQCKSSYASWLKHHKHASNSQRKAEVKSLESRHGCTAASV